MQAAWQRVRGLVLFGVGVALVRLILDATVKPGEWSWGWFVGVDLLMPIAFIVVAIKGTLGDVPWPKFILMSLILGICVWGIPNLISYTTAQFMGWTHGRFEPGWVDAAGKRHGHMPPAFGDSTASKVGMGLMIAGITTVIGAIGSLVLLTLFVWLPGRIRRRKTAPAA